MSVIDKALAALATQLNDGTLMVLEHNLDECEALEIVADHQNAEQFNTDVFAFDQFVIASDQDDFDLLEQVLVTRFLP